MRVTHDTLRLGIKNIQKTLDEIKPDIKKNTAFRNQIWGIGIGLTSVSSIVGASLVLLGQWVIGKL